MKVARAQIQRRKHAEDEEQEAKVEGVKEREVEEGAKVELDTAATIVTLAVKATYMTTRRSRQSSWLSLYQEAILT